MSLCVGPHNPSLTEYVIMDGLMVLVGKPHSELSACSKLTGVLAMKEFKQLLIKSFRLPVFVFMRKTDISNLSQSDTHLASPSAQK